MSTFPIRLSLLQTVYCELEVKINPATLRQCSYYKNKKLLTKINDKKLLEYLLNVYRYIILLNFKNPVQSRNLHQIPYVCIYILNYELLILLSFQSFGKKKN